jgi:hypothetical protein
MEDRHYRLSSPGTIYFQVADLFGKLCALPSERGRPDRIIEAMLSGS